MLGVMTNHLTCLLFDETNVGASLISCKRLRTNEVYGCPKLWKFCPKVILRKNIEGLFFFPSNIPLSA
jgi:hypothetical protein